MSFIHLRVASAYSFKYGTTQPRDLVARASELEMPALALTDRDGLAGAIRFTKAAVTHGIAPIIGVNLAIRIGDTSGALPRVTVLAHGDGGWRSLVRLMTGLQMNSPDRTPVLTPELLEKFSSYTSQLHLLHGPESPVSQALTAHRFDAALTIFNQTRDLFADHAIECVSH